MTILDGAFTGGIVLTILSFLGASLSLCNYFLKKKKRTHLSKKKIKNKRKRRERQKQLKQLTLKMKKFLRLFLLNTLLMICFGLGAGYISYYQSMNLTADDSDAIIKGYFLMEDFKKQLEIAQTKQEEKEKTQKNIRYLATSMASYGTKRASDVNSEEGQLALNRYYAALKEVGMNASTQINDFYGNEELVQEFLEDSKKVEQYGQVVFSYYKVEETALKEED